MKDYVSEVGICDLPEVVLTFILRLVPPYEDLKSCMLVNKYWCNLVRGVIRQRKAGFLNAIKNQNVLWEELNINTAGPSINKRYSHSACVHKGSLYVFGGCTTQSTTFNDLWRLDLNTRKWIRLLTTGTYPSPKACPSMISLKDDIWLFGGLTFPAAYPYHQGFRMSKELHSYNSITNKWTLQLSQNVEPSSMAGHSVTIQRDRYMVVVGGSHMSDVNNHCSSSNSIWVFDVLERKWDQKRTNLPVPVPRFMHSQVKIDEDRMLILGGCSGPNARFNDVWLLTIPENLGDLWFWKEIKVRNLHLRTNILWRNPVVKVDSALVVLGCDPNTNAHQIPIISPGSHVHPDANLNRTSWNHGSSEDNVNGRRGTFKRRLPQNVQQSESSSDEGESNLNARQPSNYRNNMFEEIDYLFSRRLYHQFVGPESSDPSAATRKNFPTSRGRKAIFKALTHRGRQPMLKGEVRQFPALHQLTLNQNNAAISTNNSQRRLQLYSIDISELLTSFTVKWLPKSGNQLLINRGPQEIIKYSFSYGNSELIVFGGTSCCHDGDCEVTQHCAAASNCVHFISTLPYII